MLYKTQILQTYKSPHFLTLLEEVPNPNPISISLFLGSTPKSRPNNIYMGLKCPSVRMYVRPSTKSFSDSDEIWYVGGK